LNVFFQLFQQKKIINYYFNGVLAKTLAKSMDNLQKNRLAGHFSSPDGSSKTF